MHVVLNHLPPVASMRGFSRLDRQAMGNTFFGKCLAQDAVVLVKRGPLRQRPE
jgi:hypothetical protein